MSKERLTLVQLIAEEFASLLRSKGLCCAAVLVEEVHCSRTRVGDQGAQAMSEVIGDIYGRITPKVQRHALAEVARKLWASDGNAALAIMAKVAFVRPYTPAAYLAAVLDDRWVEVEVTP